MPSNEAQDTPLAESFLALAKDCRYVATATQLMVQLFEGWDVVVHSPSDAWYISALLYTILVVRRKAKTLGMDITGLQYKDCAATKSQRHLFLRSMVGMSALYVLHRWTERRHRGQEGNSTSLRGSDRVQAFRNRRRAMIQHSQNQSYDSTAGSSVQSARADSSHDNTSTAVSEWADRLKQVWRRLLENFMVYQTGGPHDLLAQQSSAAWWCLRLYAAYYCLDGRFPSLGQYLLGNQVERSDPDQTRLVNQPQSHRVVALLILSHTVGSVLQHTSESIIRWLVQKFHSYHGIHVRIRGQGATSTPVEEAHASICAICQQPRKHPACPIQCGHICCWSCLQKWIAFRGECPICRTACRPQEIVALYQYQAPTENEKGLKSEDVHKLQ